MDLHLVSSLSMIVFSTAPTCCENSSTRCAVPKGAIELDHARVACFSFSSGYTPNSFSSRLCRTGRDACAGALVGVCAVTRGLSIYVLPLLKDQRAEGLKD